MRKVKNSIIKKEKGAIAIFVLVALLFMSAFLILLFANNINKSKDTQEQFKITGEIYAGEGEQGAYDQAFGELRKKNRQLLTATSQENSSTLELQNAFEEEKLSDYKIYGNSVQNGTPTPSSPVEIQSVGDKTKNLFNINNYVQDKEKKEYIVFDASNLEIGKTYTLSTNKPIYWFKISDIVNGWGSVQESNNESGITKFTFTMARDSNISENETQYIIIGDQPNARATGTAIKNISQLNGYEIQIEEGTTATAYEPYGYKIPVQVSGKNLVDVDSAVNDNLVKNDDGTYTITKTSKEWRSNRVSINIPANTKFTVSCDIIGYNGTYPVPFQMLIFFNGNSSASNNYIQFGLNTKQNTYSFGQNISSLVIYQESKMPDGTYTTFKNLQIELGETATAYEPYHAPVTTNIYLNEPLRKVGEYADYIDFKTGKVVRPVKEKIFTGEEGNFPGMGWWYWDYSITSNSMGVWYANADELGTYGSPTFANSYGLSSHFEVSLNDTQLPNYTNCIVGIVDFRAGSQPPYIGFRVLYTSTEDWLQFLKSEYSTSHPVRVHYVLLKPTEEAISLPELTAFEDYSKIEILTTVSPSKIEAEYEGYTIE